jgi:hypothetical protein
MWWMQNLNPVEQIFCQMKPLRYSIARGVLFGRRSPAATSRLLLIARLPAGQKTQALLGGLVWALDISDQKLRRFLCYDRQKKEVESLAQLCK